MYKFEIKIHEISDKLHFDELTRKYLLDIGGLAFFEGAIACLEELKKRQNLCDASINGLAGATGSESTTQKT